MPSPDYFYREKGTAKHIPFSGLGLIPVFWSQVRCRGDEENILFCEKDTWQDGTCPQKMAAAVSCGSSLGKKKYIWFSRVLILFKQKL